MSKKNVILNKWTPLLEAEGVPSISNATKNEIVAAIFESQEQDIAKNPKEYMLGEAVVTGDHGYTPADIAAGKNSGAAVNVGPAVMGMVRRAIPNMIAFDICGVQPMATPTGQIFSLRAMYGDNPRGADSAEAFNPITGQIASWSGKTGTGGKDGAFAVYTALAAGSAIAKGTTVRHIMADKKQIYVTALKDGGYTPTAGKDGVELDNIIVQAIHEGELVEISEGMATSYAELMEGFNKNTNAPAWNEMSFRIDKQTVEAKSRQLKAQYSIELAQDLQSVHGMSADAELGRILAAEIMLEINREILLWINATAQVGKTGWTNKAGGQAGVFNFADPADTRGARWAGESYKSLIIQIDKEANEIARQTGRGAGNFVIASRNLVAALAHTNMLIGPAVQGTQTGMNTDTNQSTFAGVLAGKYRVYIDQYAKDDYFTVGYKGASELDAGIYYCPYVPLTPLRGSDPKNFQPVMGFKTRYAVGINPLADSGKNSGFNQLNNGMPSKEMFGKNAYFRRVYVKGL